MQIEFFTPLALCEKGRRENNQDSLYPAVGTATVAQSFFIVCDGVGGNKSGEVASELVCSSIASYFNQFPQRVLTSEYILAAFDHAQQQFDQHITENPTDKGMASTLTLLAFHEGGALAVHCGDSRIYQFRGNQLVFQTRDHSYINDMIDNGIITAEEAVNQRKNVITRAIQGKTVKPTKPTITSLEDIQAGDYFFLCTDGICESITNEDLAVLLNDKTQTDAEKIQYLHTRCTENSKDNYSAYLIPIRHVQHKIVEAAVFTPKTNPDEPKENKLPATYSKEFKIYVIAALAIIAIVALTLAFLLKSNQVANKPLNENPAKQQQQAQTQQQAPTTEQATPPTTQPQPNEPTNSTPVPEKEQANTQQEEVTAILSTIPADTNSSAAAKPNLLGQAKQIEEASKLLQSKIKKILAFNEEQIKEYNKTEEFATLKAAILKFQYTENCKKSIKPYLTYFEYSNTGLDGLLDPAEKETVRNRLEKIMTALDCTAQSNQPKK